MEKRVFNYRGFTSFLLVFIFCVLIVSGIILYIGPHGRIAYWINWKFLGMTKPGWETVHTVFACLFIITGLFHLLSFNWKVFKNYLVSRSKKGINLKIEFLLAVIFILMVLIGSVVNIPPMKTIMVAGEKIKNIWYTQEDEPPIPHAELMTLKEICERLDISSAEALVKLRKENIKVKGVNQRLMGIAKNNERSAQEIFHILEQWAKE